MFGLRDMFVTEHLAEIIKDERVQSMYPDISQLVHEMFALLFYGMLSR